MYHSFHLTLSQGADRRTGRGADYGHQQPTGTVAGDSEAQGDYREDHHRTGQDDARTAETYRRLLGNDTARRYLSALQAQAQDEGTGSTRTGTGTIGTIAADATRTRPQTRRPALCRGRRFSRRHCLRPQRCSGHHCRTGERGRTFAQPSALRLPSRGIHRIEGREGQERQRRGSEIQRLLRLGRTPETLFLAPSTCHASRC